MVAASCARQFEQAQRVDVELLLDYDAETFRAVHHLDALTNIRERRGSLSDCSGCLGRAMLPIGVAVAARVHYQGTAAGNFPPAARVRLTG